MDIQPLSSLNSISQAQAVFYTDAFLNDVEGNLAFLKANPSASRLTITSQKAHQYKGDLKGLLVAEGQAPSLHWITIRMNDLMASADYDGVQTDFILPSEQMVTMIQRKHVMAHNIIT